MAEVRPGLTMAPAIIWQRAGEAIWSQGFSRFLPETNLFSPAKASTPTGCQGRGWAKFSTSGKVSRTCQGFDQRQESCYNAPRLAVPGGCLVMRRGKNLPVGMPGSEQERPARRSRNDDHRPTQDFRPDA